MAADWIRREIAEGMQKLLVLRLPGTPPEDAIVVTATVWMEALLSMSIRWDESLDAHRIRRAFSLLIRGCDRWPAPKHLIENLGNRDPPRALPGPKLSEEQRQKNLQRIQEMKANFLKKVNGETYAETNPGRLYAGHAGSADSGRHDQAD